MNKATFKYKGIQSRLKALDNLKDSGANIISWLDLSSAVYIEGTCPKAWMRYFNSKGIRVTDNCSESRYAIFTAAPDEARLRAVLDILPDDGAILYLCEGDPVSCGLDTLTLVSFPDNRKTMQLYNDKTPLTRDALINIIPSWKNVEPGKTKLCVIYKSSGGPVLSSVKFNTHRAPKFRLNTLVYGGSCVVKKAASPEALPHLLRIADNSKKLDGIYRNISVIPCEAKDDSLVFPYISGRSLTSGIDPCKDSVESIRDRLISVTDSILDYKCDLIPFERTELFDRIFPCAFPDAGDKCYPLINLDSNIDNFKESEGRIYCYDCEWVASFPVPVRFVRFRAYFYYYRDNINALESRISLQDFLNMFGFSKKDIELFSSMEETFQWYVNGLT